MNGNNETTPVDSLATSEATGAAPNAEDDIKTMELYNDIVRIENELRARGIGCDDAVDPHVLSTIDSMHYEGDNAIRAAIKAAFSALMPKELRD